jgi:hypothetical protein
VISDKKKSLNHPIYVVYEDLNCFILTVNEEYKEFLTSISPIVSHGQETCCIWKMYFDGAYLKEGVGAGVVIISPKEEEINFSYKLDFEATNNIGEYEALILVLEIERRYRLLIWWCLGSLNLQCIKSKLVSRQGIP